MAIYKTGWPGLVNVRVTSASLKEEMIWTRGAAYASWGWYLPPSDVFDECLSTTGFLLREHGRAVGTIRITVGNLSAGIATPNCQMFEEEIAKCVGNQSFVDVSRLAAVNPDGRTSPKYCFALFQNATAMADEAGCRFLLALTRADHTRFYEGMGFKQVALPRRIMDAPLPGTLILLDWAQYRRWICSHRRYRNITSDRNIRQTAA